MCRVLGMLLSRLHGFVRVLLFGQGVPLVTPG